MKISSGNVVLDELLEGGFDSNIITTIYGPAGSGKTNFCMIASISAVKNRKKVIFIDTEGGFSVDRMRQIDSDFKSSISNMVFLRPVNFSEQRKAFEKLKLLVNSSIGLIVVDTISSLYRLEIRNNDIHEINSLLGRQVNDLLEIARRFHIPVLLTNQVYADFELKDEVKLVGGDLLRYSSKCLIELKKSVKGNRMCVLRKHRSISDEKEIGFKIVDKGVILL